MLKSHCVESGESAQQAFGGAVEYARNLGLPVLDEDFPGALTRWLGPDLVQVVGMILLIWSFDTWLPGAPLDITAWHLVCIATCFLGSVVVGRLVDPILRGTIRTPKRTGLALGLSFIATAATSVAAFMLMNEVIWRVPAGWGLTVGAAVMAAGLWWAFTMRSRDDLITSPLEHTDSTASGDEPGRLTRLLESGNLGTLICMVLTPVFTVSLLATTLVLYLISPR